MIGRLMTRAKPPPATTMTAMPMMTAGRWPYTGDMSAMDPLLPVTEEAALDLAVVSGFIQVVCALVLQMPLGAYVGSEEIATPPVLRNPSPGPNRVFHDFICEYARELTLNGNYVAVLGDPSWNGWPDVLYPIPHGAWSLDHGGMYIIGGERYPSREIFHVRVRCGVAHTIGMGLMQTHHRLLASAIAAESFAATYFTGGAVPPAVLTHPNSELTQDQAMDLKAKLTAATRTRSTVVMPAGSTITPLNSDAEKAQLGETRKWGAQQLAIALGCPPALLGLEGSSMTYRNIGEVFQQFVTTTLMSYLVPLEQQITSQLLPRGTTARFSPNAVLRPDLAARVELAVKGLVGGVYTPDEARSLLELPPGGEVANITDVADVTDRPKLAVVPQEVAP